MNKGQKLWTKAEKIIPGGNGLLSKRPDRYLPKLWPTYFSKSKGINIWDLENNKFKDMAQMGMGTCILGYANNDIDRKVKNIIDKGINSTLNCPEEYELANRILKYDNFADQVKFAKGGGEAMSIAVRLARAESGKDTIAFSGYHGWCDWYLATNLKNKNNLKDHLLPGLEPIGVPKKLKGSVVPFEYNNVNAFKKISRKNLAAVVIEGSRYFYPTKEFIHEIQKFCKKNKICLIIDEITSGWRSSVGGIYKQLNIKPDIVVYGKGLGNGYPISCIVGKKKYMNYASKSFISSTAWTERSGFVAANATIDFFVKKKVHKHIVSIGSQIKKGWINLAIKNNLKLKVSEIDSLCTFFLEYKNKDELYTLFCKEMLKQKYIASNSIYVSYSHKKRDISEYLKSCDKVFKKIFQFLKEKKKMKKSDIKFTGFTRLTLDK
jgi:glutamate-1-semialdehyde 2,1-aminomutase